MTLIASFHAAFCQVDKTRKVRTYGVLPSSVRIHFARRMAFWSGLRPRRISHTLHGRRAGVRSILMCKVDAGNRLAGSRYEGKENRQGRTV